MEAVILAGGLGTRLRCVVADSPKCLAPIASEPFLSYVMEWLGRSGVDRVVISVGYLKEQIISWVSNRYFPFEIDWAVEDEPLGTGGGIRLALSKCRSDEVIVVNGDTFFPVDLSQLFFDAPITVALKPMRDFDRYGTVVLEGRKVDSFREKAPCKEGLINGGVYGIDRSRLDLENLPAKFSFEKEVLEPLAAKGQVNGWVQDTYFIDIGIPEDYSKAQEELPQYRAVKRASALVLSSHADTLFLDRDGTVNVHIEGDYVRNWEQFRFLPGILEEFPKWAEKFRRIIVVTNQRGVGKGLMTDDALADIHRHMLRAVNDAGGRIDAIFTCTAVNDDDPRRKPNPGMFREALQLFPDIGKAVMLGDNPSVDAVFAIRSGMEFILL